MGAVCWRDGDGCGLTAFIFVFRKLMVCAVVDGYPVFSVESVKNTVSQVNLQFCLVHRNGLMLAQQLRLVCDFNDALCVRGTHFASQF